MDALYIKLTLIEFVYIKFEPLISNLMCTLGDCLRFKLNWFDLENQFELV